MLLRSLRWIDIVKKKPVFNCRNNMFVKCISQWHSENSHGPAMAYMSHGRADAESLLEFMDSQCRPMSEILTISWVSRRWPKAEEDVGYEFVY